MNFRYVGFFSVILLVFAAGHVLSTKVEAEQGYQMKSFDREAMESYKTDRNLLKDILSKEEETLRLLNDIKKELADLKKSCLDK